MSGNTWRFPLRTDAPLSGVPLTPSDRPRGLDGQPPLSSSITGNTPMLTSTSMSRRLENMPLTHNPGHSGGEYRILAASHQETSPVPNPHPDPTL